MKLTIPIEGMHCASCETLLTELLCELPGVSKAHVSMQAKSATVEYDAGKVTEKDMRKAIEAEGYKTQ
jgi:copper chaperone CopZ